jgi:hypothetical protein
VARDEQNDRRTAAHRKIFKQSQSKHYRNPFPITVTDHLFHWNPFRRELGFPKAADIPKAADLTFCSPKIRLFEYSQPREFRAVKRAAVVVVVVVLGLALLVRRHVISPTTLTVILLLAAAALAYVVLIWPNLRPRS